MGKKKDKTFRVFSVDFDTDEFGNFAKDLEDALNGLEEDGYGIQLMPTTRGIMVLGTLSQEPGREQVRKNFAEMFQSIGAALGSKTEAGEVPARGREVPARVRELLDAIVERAKIDTYEGMEEALPRVLPAILRGAAFHELLEMADECEEAAKHHDKCHPGPEKATCGFSPLLRALAERMRDHAKLHVQ